MKKKISILIITYYFPPYTGIEGQRAVSWHSGFQKQGVTTEIITRMWPADTPAQNWEDYQSTDSNDPFIIESEKGKVHYLPHRHRKFYAFSRKIPILNTIVYWGYKFFGHFHIETDAHNSFENYAEKLVSKGDFDFIIVSTPPLNIIRLGYKLSKKYNVRLIADYRDTFDNQLLNKKLPLTFSRAVENFLFRRYIKKWTSQVDLNLVVSPAMLEILPVPVDKSEIIYNGFEESIFSELRKIEPDKEKFIIHVLGNLYEFQAIDTMIDGYTLFYNAVTDKSSVRFDFIGLGIEHSISEKLRNVFPSDNLFITNRIKRSEALNYLAKASLCFNSPGAHGYKGILGGKTFDYMGAGKYILICPSDNDLVQDTIQRYKLGSAVNTAEEIRDVLLEEYTRWKNGILFTNQFEDVRVFSREFQSDKLVNRISDLFQEEA